jgi:hypothetical protein
MSQLDLD